MLLEHLAQLGRDALGKEHGDARADADELHMRDGAETAQQVVELAVAEQERVAAGEQHVADFGMGLDVTQALLVFGMEIVVLRVRNQPAPGAIAAIGGATVGDQKQHAVRITMHEARHRRVFVLPQRVEHLLRMQP